MADFIFPTTRQAGPLGSEKNINTISTETLLTKIAEMKAQGDGLRLPAELLTKIAEGKLSEEDCEGDECEDEKKDKKSKKALPDALREHMFKCKLDDKEESDNDDDMIKRGKTASTRQRKVLFASSESLSAEALEADRAAGRMDLFEARLAARQKNREITANKIIALTNERTQIAQKFAKKNDYRVTVVSETKQTTQKLASVKPVAKRVVDPKSSDKTTIASALRERGFNEQYIKQIVGYNTPRISEAETNIRTVMSSGLDKSVIRLAVAGLVRTANLGKDQLDRCKDYWKNELHYGDPEWVDDLYSAEFSDGKSEKDTTV